MKFYQPLIFILALTFGYSHSYAEELPKWEFGLGAGGLYQSLYTGTKETRTFFFPAPLIVYRGDIFKSDDEGVRAQLSKTPTYKLDISLDFNLAVDSDDVELRRGLPDIDNLLQIGPSLEITLDKNPKSEWQLRLPIRSSFAISSDGVSQAGYTFSPNLAYFHQLHSGAKPWRFNASFGPQFADSEYNNIFYGVEPQFATTERTAFDADSGFAGTRSTLSLVSKNRKRLIVFFLRYDNISGAVFDDSPLVETKDNLTAGFIYSYYLFKSKQKVRTKDR